jgi:hypothetical protein
MNKPGNILVVPDLHAPFQHPKSFNFLQSLKQKYKPDEVVFIGDEVDLAAISRFAKDPNGYGAADEFSKAKKILQQYYKLFPKAKCCVSNHTARPLKKAFEAGIPQVFLKSYSEFLDAPKTWEWRDKWEINGIVFEHGEGVSGINGALTRARANMKPTVIGHTHCGGGVQYWNGIWALNVGCLIDSKTYAFAYAKHWGNKPTLGAGVIINGVPHFIPLV